MTLNICLKQNIKQIMLVIILVISIIPFSLNATNYIQAFITSHYITLITNNIFLGICNHVICQYIDVQNLIIQRKNFSRYTIIVFVSVISLLIIYIYLILCCGLLIFDICKVINNVSLYYTFYCFIVLFCCNMILLLQILTGKNNVYIIFVMLVNLIVHYCLIIPNINF